MSTLPIGEPHDRLTITRGLTLTSGRSDLHGACHSETPYRPQGQREDQEKPDEHKDQEEPDEPDEPTVVVICGMARLDHML